MNTGNLHTGIFTVITVHVLLYSSLHSFGSATVELASSVEACPGQVITFTCTIPNSLILVWFVEPFVVGDDMRFSAGMISSGADDGVRDVQGFHAVTGVTPTGGGRYTLQSNLSFTATTELYDTLVVCRDALNNLDANSSISDTLQDPPSPPSNFRASKSEFQSNSYTILVMWDSLETAENYTITYTDTSAGVERDVTSAKTYMITTAYNMFVNISVFSSNCAGNSTPVNLQVDEAGCSAPDAPVNGTVLHFTSARLGAEITYQCNAGLVLEGERVAHCSTSLQWEPSSGQVTCCQPHPGDCADPGVPQNGGVTDYNTANGSTITFYCDSGFTLHGSSTSQCVSGEWTPRPEDVLCVAEQDNVTSSTSVPTTDQPTKSPTAASAPISAIVAPVVVVVAVVGISILVTVFVVVLYRCRSDHRKKSPGVDTNGKQRGQTERPPVYENIQPDERAGIELKHNEAYGHI